MLFVFRIQELECAREADRVAREKNRARIGPPRTGAAAPDPENILSFLMMMTEIVMELGKTRLRKLAKDFLLSYTWFSCSISGSDNYLKSLIMLIVKDYLPFSVVDSRFYRNHIKAMDPEINIPSRKTLVANIDKFF